MFTTTTGVSDGELNDITSPTLLAESVQNTHSVNQNSWSSGGKQYSMLDAADSFNRNSKQLPTNVGVK